MNRTRAHGLQELTYELYGKYMPEFKARLTHAMSQEVLKIEKQYGVIIDAEPHFMDESYLTIYIPLQEIRELGEKEDK